MPNRRNAALALAAILALGAGAAQAQSFSASEREEIEGFVHQYLVNNPQVLEEAMRALEAQRSQAEESARRDAVAENREAIFDSERQIVLGNPDGAVTLVEFFDYNCGYCKSALDDMASLLESEDDLRVVLKEFPVLGPESLEAAQVSIVVSRLAPQAYEDFHTRLLGAEGQVAREEALAAAEAAGLDRAEIEAGMEDEAVRATIEESYRLANALGLTGTPSYVVGEEVLMGAVGLEALKERIDAARDSD